MQLQKRLLWIGIVCCFIITIFSASLATAQYPVFYVCFTNYTNNTVYYSGEWCTREGYNCSGYLTYSVAPGNVRTHWGSPGVGRFDVRMHTGGQGGVWHNYTFYGSPDSCSGSFAIRYNDRGFLRIY
jgi:hypothetical protein